MLISWHIFLRVYARTFFDRSQGICLFKSYLTECCSTPDADDGGDDDSENEDDDYDGDDNCYDDHDEDEDDEDEDETTTTSTKKAIPF